MESRCSLVARSFTLQVVAAARAPMIRETSAALARRAPPVQQLRVPAVHRRPLGARTTADQSAPAWAEEPAIAIQNSLAQQAPKAASAARAAPALAECPALSALAAADRVSVPAAR